MIKGKERSVNPALAQRRLEKQRALKKGKAEVQARRNEKLARRNPERLQRQIDNLRAAEQRGQPLRPHDKQVLEQLERDLRAVTNAREVLGDKAPAFPSGGARRAGGDLHGGERGGFLGKRRRDGAYRWGRESDSSDTDESVKRIPMPKDTSPPIPRRRWRTNEPTANHAEEEQQGPHALPRKPPVLEVKTVYESAPVIRNLRQEAVSRFVPAAVRRKQEAVEGKGTLIQPEEMEQLEQQGYVLGADGDARTVQISPRKELNVGSILEEEEKKFEREIKSVQIEEVEDEDL